MTRSEVETASEVGNNAGSCKPSWSPSVSLQLHHLASLSTGSTNITINMSIEVIPMNSSFMQPFQCPICRSRFTRHENLKRHAALHTRPSDKAAYSCKLCSAKFSRSDLCTRHMRRKHPEHKEQEGAVAAEHSRVSLSASPEWTRKRKRSQDTGSVLSSSLESGGTLHSEGWDNETGLDIRSQTWPIMISESEEYGYPGTSSPDSPHSATCTTSEYLNVAETEMNSGSVQVQGSSGATSMPHSAPSFSSMFTQMDLSISPGISALDFDLLEPDLPGVTDTWKSSMSEANTLLHRTLLEAPSPRDLRPLQDEWHPSSSQIERGIELYYTYVSPIFPFLHQPTFFAAKEHPYLVLSMLSLGYQYGADPDWGTEALSDQSLSLHCFHKARTLLANAEENVDSATQSIPMVQAYLLLEVCAMMYLCGENSAYGLKMHSRMIFLTRSSGMTQLESPSSRSAQDLQEMWQDFIQAESQKRTVLAVHQIDALWYQLLSIPRSISHLEMKLEMPCPTECWTAPTAEGWAYQQLIARPSRPPVQYSAAVRHLLSLEAETVKLPPFDPYGAINIAQFLLSSVREVSGWSAMTGRLSLDRLEPLRSSLIKLGPLLQSPGGAPQSPLGALYEATWQIAMIELRIWSSSHTCGIIEGSLNAVLQASTKKAAAGEISFEPQIAQPSQPHIDWFLRYLDTTVSPEAEPPWVALYAYKAFLISWQLLRNKTPNAMRAVGIEDDDAESALAWIRKVFQRRSGREVGKMIITCLDIMQPAGKKSSA